MTGEVPSKPFLDTRPWLLWILLAIIFAGSFGVRLINFKNLPLDFHSDRQLQSMIKARGMYYQTLINVPDWQKNMAILQWHEQPVEEPEIMERLAAIAYQVAGGVELWIPRLFSILFWLGGGIALFFLVRAMIGTEGAIVGVVFYLFEQYGVIASRAFQPDPLMVAAIIVGVWALYRWYRSPTWVWTIVAGLLCGLAIYIKVPAGFFVAGGIGGLLFWDRGFKKTVLDPKVWVLGVLALLPAIIYHILGTYVLKFLGASYFDLRIYPNLMLQPYYYLLWLGKINQVVGFPAFVTALLGTFLITNRRARALLAGLWIGYFIYGIIFIYFSGSHDYYSLPLYPLVAIGLAAVAQVVIERLHSIWKHAWVYLVVLALLVGWVGQRAYDIRNNFRSQNYSTQIASYEKIGDEIRSYQVVGVVDDYAMRMEYWGWTMVDYWPNNGDFLKSSLSGGTVDLQALFKKLTTGEDLFLVTQLGELDRQPGLKQILYNNYGIFDKGDTYIIFDLRKPKTG
jgi:hypothetical protein